MRGGGNGKNWVKVLERICEVCEEGRKVGGYEKGLKKGVRGEEWGYEGGDLMELKGMGNWVECGNGVLRLLNGKVEGKDKLIGCMKEDGIGRRGGIGGCRVGGSGLG